MSSNNGVFDLLRQTMNNLHRDGTLWQWRTWKSAASFLFGRQGMIRLTYKPWRAYKRPDFHPNQLANELSRNWLQNHAETYLIVGATALVVG
ncbi:metal-dependent hydrolase [Rhodoferax sp. UBA5149]|uniref:metal-dependent hydrolase n=1 Tax=Rhodoferax sp. UBA5149 TaxID=1947379 RepID=UPI0025F68168|nr:metal-dependent hydrolase [Rhodoferax sp. UBA5149]